MNGPTPPDNHKDGNNILAVLGSEDALETVAAYADAALDSQLSDEALAELFGLESLFKVGRVVQGIRERLFLKKLAICLRPVHQLPFRVRRGFWSRVEGDPRARRRVGEGLILLLDRHEHFSKSEVLGLVFREHIAGRIDYRLFQRAASLIDRASTGDLDVLSELGTDPAPVRGSAGQELAAIGAVVSRHAVVIRESEDGLYAQFDDYTSSTSSSTHCWLNEAGRLVAALLAGREPEGSS